jgi:glycerol-3-phosphate acyltransferase PlsY
MPSRTATTLGYIAAFFVTEAIVLAATVTLVAYSLFRLGIARYRYGQPTTFNEAYLSATEGVFTSPAFWFLLVPLTSAFTIYLMRQMHHRLYAGTGQLASIKQQSITSSDKNP